MNTLVRPPVGSPWLDWFEFGSTLSVPEGVHHPSAFSAVLAAALPDLTGRVVVDAGAGAGLITIAALANGASHVVAYEIDPDAIAATRQNVERTVHSLDRVSSFQGDFRNLGLLNADVVLANPPQRPTRILEAVEDAERHLHAGAGDDGLDVIRLLLSTARSNELYTTAAGVLDLDRLDVPTWGRRERVATTTVPMHPAWSLLGSDGRVNVWRFVR
jgi:methylase of polypeptide subunit release factors